MTDTSPHERDCQTTIIEAARMLGYLVHHSRPARSAKGWRTAIQGDAGLPDLLIVGHGKVFAVELKRRGGKPTDEQVAWLAAFHAAGVDGGVVYVPDEQQAFIDRLTLYATAGSTT